MLRCEKMTKYPNTQFRKLIENVKNKFSKILSTMNLRIDFFKEVLLDEINIPESSIDRRLTSIIHSYIDNYTDSEILSSALQIQKNRNIFLFVTADKHFSFNEYDFLKEQFEINYKKENW